MKPTVRELRRDFDVFEKTLMGGHFNLAQQMLQRHPSFLNERPGQLRHGVKTGTHPTLSYFNKDECSCAFAWLLQQGAKIHINELGHSTLVHQAVRANSAANVRALFVAGGLDYIRHVGKFNAGTPLHVAVNECHVHMVKTLLELDPDGHNVPDRLNLTPMQHSARNQEGASKTIDSDGHARILALLLAHQARRLAMDALDSTLALTP